MCTPSLVSLMSLFSGNTYTPPASRQSPRPKKKKRDMTNEEPVPSTSCVLSTAEKNVKIEPPQSSKKRKGLDIDALWRKKFKDVENQKSPEKPAASSPEEKASSSKETGSSDGSSEEKTSPVETTSSLVVSQEETKDVKIEEPSVPEPPSAPSAPSGPITTTPTKSQRKQVEAAKPAPPPPPRSPSPVGRTTRSARKRTEAVRKGMNDLEDVKPNIKFLKKSLQGSNGTTEMEVIQRGGDDSNGGRDDYEYGQIEYANAVTPNGTYTIYGPESTYTQYYPGYATNTMQASPQEAGGQYLVQAPQSPLSNEDQEAAVLQNSQRASPATVNWLFDNYEIAEGSSLPRCQLYDHYKKHCEEHRMDPVNAASFGKLIRSVFHNLKTRRLGTRGNSKYHYYGIRMKDSSTLHEIRSIQPQATIHQQVYTPPMQQLPHRDAYADTVNQVAAQKYMNSEVPSKKARKERSMSSSTCRESSSPMLDLPNQHPYLGENTPGVVAEQTQVHTSPYVFTEKDKASMGTLLMPTVPFKDKDAFAAHQNFRKFGVTVDIFNTFIHDYDHLCREILDSVKTIRLGEVDTLWHNFWTGTESISQEDLQALCSIDKVQDWIIEMDITLYQTIVDCLIPHVLLSELSSGMTHSCRTFSKNIDINLRKAMNEGKMPDSFIKRKIHAITYMQQGLKRYTSLNHLAHAARGVLMKQEQCQQMIQDYAKVDIETVHHQAGWICGCDYSVVAQINAAFKQNLHSTSPMEKWAEWLESIVDQVLSKYHNKPAKEVENVGKQFLLNWSFYTSMIIRELTLRSAASFGSFTLVRLLADDYMYYLIESKIAKAGNQQLITVIRQEKEWPLPRVSVSQEYIVPPKDEPKKEDVNRNGISS